MYNQRTFRNVTFIVLLVILLIISSCAMPTISRFSVDDPSVEEYFKTTATISLAWNYDEPATIQSYKLYYKANEDIEWILLDTIPATVPIFEVEHATIGDGSWDFGVSSVDLLGNESEIHSSLDFNADPTTGWYLLWVN